MRGLGAQGTSGWSRPERQLFISLQRLGVETEAHAHDLPGTPDLIIRGMRIAVFVHGCFWHGCEEHYRAPESSVKFWDAKLERNKRRDRDAATALEALGWTVVIVWEHDVPLRAAEEVLNAIDRVSKSVREIPQPDARN